MNPSTPSSSKSIDSPSRQYRSWTAFALAGFGLILRLWGIAWSLPDARHYYSYHPDEILVLAASQSADLWHGALNPHFYNYGSLPVYLISLLRPLAYALLSPSLYTDYLLGRFITALMGAATVGLTYAIAKRIAGETAGWIAGIGLAIAPMHVLHSHYVTVDVPAAFWVALCLLLCLKSRESEDAKWLLLAGVAAGCAAGTKYNAGIVAFSVIAAGYRNPKRMGKSLLATVAAFLVSTPGFLLWPSEFWRDFRYELHHTQTGHGLVFVGTAPGWIYHWTFNLRWGLGEILYMVVSVAFISALIRLFQFRSGGGYDKPNPSRLASYAILMAFAIPYYLAIGAAQVKFMRYMIPMLPVLLAIFGSEVAYQWERIANPISKRSKGSGEAIVFGAIGAATLAYTLAYAVGFDALFSETPPQDRAAAWLRSDAQGQTVGLTTVPWFYSPPVSPFNGGPQTQRGFYEHIAESPYRLVVTDTDASRLNDAKPRYLILSEYETMEPLRLLQTPAGRLIPDVAKFAAFWDAVNRDYSLAFVAANRPSLPSWMLPKGEPPHDWLYPYPTVAIWERKASASR